MFPLAEGTGAAPTAGEIAVANLTGWIVLITSLVVTLAWLVYLYR